MVEITSIPRRFEALGVALHYLSRQPPFAGFRTSELVPTIDGQIRRGHCRFAVEGKVVVGYLGWALYDADHAEDFARTGRSPDNTLANGRDVVWVLTAAASDGGVLLDLVKHLRSLHAGKRVMGIRHSRPGRRVVFNRVLQPLEPGSGALGEEA